MFKMAQRAQASSHQSISGLNARAHLRSEPLLKTTTRGIRANTFIGRNINHKKRSEVLDMNGEIDGCMGVIHLNKEYQYNMLTPSFINEINRGIASLDVNQIVSTIFMAPQLGQEFSNGTDFKALAQMQKESNNDAIAAYLTQIYRLQVQMAALNKPLIAVAPGHSFNSGATLLAASGIPLVNNGSKLAFNEALFGFVPHAGATYYLSRLPGEFGTFLALTGMRIDGSDAIKLGLAHGAVQDPLLLQEEVGEIVRSQETRPEYGQEYFRNRLKKIKGTNLPQHFANGADRRAVEEWLNVGKFNQIDQNRLANGELDMGKYEEFIEAKDRIPSAVAEAEYRYMKMLRADEALQNQNKPDPYLEFGKNEIDRDNLFLYYESFKNQRNYLTSFLQQWYKEDLHTALRHQKLIDRCFYSRSVEEIMENLRKEPHPFAKECLEHMERNSLVSLQLTREMMHRAQNLDYTGCMEMEVRVAVNRVSDPDFALGVEKVLKTKTPYVDGKAAKRTNPGFSKKKLNQGEIERYFDETPLTKKVNVGAVRYALLPTRHHFERFTDHLRIWINEESTADGRIRIRFDQQAKEALRKEGIDVRDKALTIQDAREHLAAKLAKERVENVRQQRFNQIMLDEQLRDNYFQKVDKEYQSLVSDQAKFYERVNQHISDIFDMALSERLEKMHERSKEAQTLEKRRFIVGIKKFMFKNRVLSYAKQSFKAELARIKNYPYRLPHGQELPEQSWHDVQHPQIDKSPLFLISKAIGRVSLSPVEMTKEYLTNPKAREQLTMLTLDKGELQKLQNDVLTDPEKYIKVFTRREQPNDDLTWPRMLDQIKFEDRDFWWRFHHNNQVTPMEKWPKKHQFEMYKDWADGVESKAIDTLRSCLSELILGLKEDRKVSPKIDKSLTKREQLEHLMVILDTSYDPSTLQTAKRTKVLTRPNESQSKDDLDQLHLMIQKLLSEDRQFKMLYKKDMEGNITQNPKIAKLRSEAEEELLKLVEIVLLDKYGKHTTEKQQNQLNERLKTILTPKGKNENSSSVQQQLGVIDWYLDKETRQEGLKDALDLVKPYFVNIFQRKLQEAATEVLNELQWKTTNHLVQINYVGELNDPGFAKGKALRKKFYSKDWEHEKRMIIERAQPILSPIYELKELQAANWTERVDIHKDPEYQKLSLAEKKRLEEREVRKRNRDYANIKAEIVVNQYKSQGIHNVEDILNAMIGQATPEAKKLINNLTDENAAQLEKLGFSKDHIRLLKVQKEIIAEIDALPQEEKVKYENKEIYKSHTRSERHQIDTTAQQSEAAMRFLHSVRYEIENNMNSFDWLQMYSKVLGVVDFNELIEDYHYTIQRLKAQEKQTQLQMLHKEEPEFEYVKPTDLLKTPEEWAQIKEYAEYLSDFYLVNLKTIEDQVTIDLENYMQHSQGEYIFNKAIADRNQFVKEEKEKSQLDRNLFIKGSIEDFNALQAQKESNQRLRDEIRASAATKPKQVIDFVESLLTAEKNYVDLKKLKKRLESGNCSTELDGLVDQKKLVQDLKLQGDLIPGFMESFAQTPTDVISLDEAKARLLSDNSLSQKDKQLSKEIIDHIAESSRLVANERRQAITISQFLGNQGHTNSESFTKYASNLLAQKLRDVVDSLDFTENPKNVEWELGRSRTSPFDLKEGGQKTRAEVEELINRIVNDQEEDPIMKIAYFDEEVNGLRLERDREHELRKVLFDAADVTAFPHDLEQVKALYENKFLQALTSPNSFEKQAEQIIGDYTDLRLRHCMLQPDFQAKMHSKYGFLYMKMLRERVIDELKITRDAEILDLSHMHFKEFGKDKLRYDVEALYNLSHLNSVHAMGYDRLLERANATTLKEQADIAQPTVVDKLLADYFLGKKSEVQEANKLIYDLAEIFDKDVKGGTNSFDTVLKKQRLQNMDKQESRKMHFEAFKDMMDLDVITSRALQKNKNGLSNELREVSITETDHKDHWLTQVPDYFDMMDVRKPPSQVVDDKLFMVIKQAFDVRKTLETKMSRRELLAFDQVLARHLQFENLAPRLKESIREEFNVVNQGRQVIEHKNNNQFNERVQGYKRESMQREFNKSVKDVDAQYKSLAFATMLEQQGKEIMERPGKSSNDKLELMFFDRTFPRWYLQELDKDAHRNPRPIDANDYQQRKWFEIPKYDEKFMDKKAREKQLFDDHRIYQENRKEQQERIQLFYILEQFFQNARAKPDANSSAQEAIKEYFAKPENTFFFDKNKI